MEVSGVPGLVAGWAAESGAKDLGTGVSDGKEWWLWCCFHDVAVCFCCCRHRAQNDSAKSSTSTIMPLISRIITHAPPAV